jgi:uncharacterized protein with PIN domain
MGSPPARHASCRFYAELNDFLPKASRHRDLERALDGLGTVKDLIEACGVPHPEVELVLVNGEVADFSRPVAPGDRVSVYPAFRRIALGPGVGRRSRRPPDVRFVLDVHLGRLAAYLRLAGFDTLYATDWPDAHLAALAERDGRILLTRDRELLKRRSVEWGYWVRETRPRRQLAEVVERFDLAPLAAPFSRCGRCNGLLEAVDRAAVLDELPLATRRRHRAFRRCRGCGRLYWRGSHVAALERLFAAALADPR